MRSESESFIKDIAGSFDEQRKILPMGKKSWLALLARDGRSKVFHQLRYYSKGFIYRTTNFRTGFYVEIATSDDLTVDIQECTYFALNGICYAVSEGDVFQPTLERLTWMIYGKFVRDTYTPTI